MLGIVIAYDCTDLEGFSAVKEYVVQANKIKEEDAVLVLAAAKIDMEKRTVTPEMGLQLAEENGCLYFETSALDGTGVEEMFIAIATEIRRRVRETADKLGEF
jgi:GTPase SAR1 family protein